jgi:hypothetical protein
MGDENSNYWTSNIFETSNRTTLNANVQWDMVGSRIFQGAWELWYVTCIARWEGPSTGGWITPRPMPGRHGYNKPLNHRNRNPKSNFPFCQNPVSMVPNMCKCHPPWFLMGAPLQLVLYRQGHSSFDGKWCAWTRQMSTELIERSKTCFDTSKTHKIHWHLTFP